MTSQLSATAWREWRAEAARAKQLKLATPEQLAHLAMRNELNEHMAAMHEGSALLHFPDRTPVPVYPNGVSETMRNQSLIHN